MRSKITVSVALAISVWAADVAFAGEDDGQTEHIYIFGSAPYDPSSPHFGDFFGAPVQIDDLIGEGPAIIDGKYFGNTASHCGNDYTWYRESCVWNPWVEEMCRKDYPHPVDVPRQHCSACGGSWGPGDASACGAMIGGLSGGAALFLLGEVLIISATGPVGLGVGLLSTGLTAVAGGGAVNEIVDPCAKTCVPKAGW
jgi:hypothetical protein